MAFTNIYDNTFPPDTQLANLLGSDLRAFRLDIQQRVAAMSGLDASKPNFAGDAQPATWNGILFFATDTGKIYQFNNPSWTDVTANFTSITEVLSYVDTGGSTNGNGQTLFSISIPAGVLKINSILHISEMHTYTGVTSFTLLMGTANVGLNSFVPSQSNSTFCVSFDVIITQNTTMDAHGFYNLLVGGSAVAGASNGIGQVITNITTTPFVVSVTQVGTGTLTAGSLSVSVIQP